MNILAKFHGNILNLSENIAIGNWLIGDYSTIWLITSQVSKYVCNRDICGRRQTHRNATTTALDGDHYC